MIPLHRLIVRLHQRGSPTPLVQGDHHLVHLGRLHQVITRLHRRCRGRRVDVEDHGMSATMYSLREAAELCGVSLVTMRRRADRGTIQTTLTDGERRVPLSELERAGLLPDAELQQLRRRVERLTDELASSRQLVVSTERAAQAEREVRERLEEALFERQAAASQAEAAAAQADQVAAAAIAAGEELRALEADLRVAGPIRAWKLARTRRKAAETA